MGLKPGYKTTEFWVAVLVGLASVVTAAAGWLPPRYAALASAVAGAAYALARGLAKLNPPKDAGTPPPA